LLKTIWYLTSKMCFILYETSCSLSLISQTTSITNFHHLQNSSKAIKQLIVSIIILNKTINATPLVTHSQLFERLKSESKYKTAEGEGVGARSLAHNTLRGRGACWSSEIGLGRVHEIYSITQARTQPTNGG